jgi:Mn2+/Fe2+ NRAMP family transporter
VFLLVMVNDRALMGRHVNSWRSNALGIAITLIIAVAGSAYAVVAFLATLHPGH